jgi:hypothetical protein
MRVVLQRGFISIVRRFITAKQETEQILFYFETQSQKTVRVH